MMNFINSFCEQHFQLLLFLIPIPLAIAWLIAIIAIVKNYRKKK